MMMMTITAVAVAVIYENVINVPAATSEKNHGELSGAITRTITTQIPLTTGRDWPPKWVQETFSLLVRGMWASSLAWSSLPWARCRSSSSGGDSTEYSARSAAESTPGIIRVTDCHTNTSTGPTQQLKAHLVSSELLTAIQTQAQGPLSGWKHAWYH